MCSRRDSVAVVRDATKISMNGCPVMTCGDCCLIVSLLLSFAVIILLVVLVLFWCCCCCCCCCCRAAVCLCYRGGWIRDGAFLPDSAGNTSLNKKPYWKKLYDKEWYNINRSFNARNPLAGLLSSVHIFPWQKHSCPDILWIRTWILYIYIYE